VNAALASSLLARIGTLRIGETQLSGELSKMSGTIISVMSSELARLVGTATSVAINVALAVFGLYYLLGASSRTWEFARQYVPFSARTADALRDRFVGATQATLLGTGIDLSRAGSVRRSRIRNHWIARAAFWGSVAAVAAIIPAIGSTIVWLPGVLLLVSSTTTRRRYAVRLRFRTRGNVDQVVRPLVYRRLSEMHPMITFVGVLAGIRYLGVVGLLLGPLAIVYVFELLRFYREEYTRRDHARTAFAHAAA
jgi:predicted PurR-regulated permease PerM